MKEQNTKGLVHIYTGDGKGKTTAAAGLALRFAGSGGKVLFTQFLKDGSSSEVSLLRQIPGIEVFSCPVHYGFSFCMTEEEKRKTRIGYAAYFGQIRQKIAEGDFGLLVLDELTGACRNGFLPVDEVVSFLQERPQHLEVVMTGRNPDEKLKALADYITEMKKIRHPYDQGIHAREGIEF